MLILGQFQLPWETLPGVFGHVAVVHIVLGMARSSLRTLLCRIRRYLGDDSD